MEKTLNNGQRYVFWCIFVGIGSKFWISFGSICLAVCGCHLEDFSWRSKVHPRSKTCSEVLGVIDLVEDSVLATQSSPRIGILK